jgi:hypothetical protein
MSKFLFAKTSDFLDITSRFAVLQITNPSISKRGDILLLR